MLNHYLPGKYNLIRKQFVVVCLVVQLLMINTICQFWIFNESNKVAVSAATNMLQFDVWITLEICVFLAYIASAILYLLIRSFKVQEHNLQTHGENDIATEMTDTLEQSSVTMECFESFSAPLFASALLRSDLFDFDYHVLMREHAAAKHISNFFLYFK